MPIYKTIDVNDLDWTSLIDADLVSVSEAFARTYSFLHSDTERVAFQCDAATVNAFRVACCKLVSLPTDKVSEFQTVARKNAAGATIWKRLKKGEAPKKGEETRNQTVRHYSGDAKRKGVRMFRESQGIALKRLSQGDGLYVIGLTRNASDEGDTDS